MSEKNIQPHGWLILVAIFDFVSFAAAFAVIGYVSDCFYFYGVRSDYLGFTASLTATTFLWLYAMGLYRMEGLTLRQMRPCIAAAFLLAGLFIALLLVAAGLRQSIDATWLVVLPTAFVMIFVGRLIAAQLIDLDPARLHIAREKRQLPLLAPETKGFFIRRSLPSRAVKRLVDILLSAALVVLTLPVMLAAAVAILLEDGRPVLYRQDRVGLNGAVFPLLKFRSMWREAEADGIARWASKNDCRITRVGHVLRRTRIDELPQLLNVLLGCMSLVGPRPERPSIVAVLEKAVPNYALRHKVKPGLTGWAQVNYQYGASVADAMEKTRYDFFYLKNGSTILDAVILMQTVRVVVLGEGAR